MGKRRRLAQNAQPRKHPRKKNGSGSGSNSGAGGSSSASAAAAAAAPKPRKGAQAAAAARQHAEPVIPFSPEDRILLVGDGDLSFGASLVEHHCCADVTATVLDRDPGQLAEKYPQAAGNVARIEAGGGRVLFGVDATAMRPFVDRRKKGGGAGAGVGVMDRIIFNFPHVGGKSTDVNRQVRYNQELLVAFFGRAAPSLAPGGSIVVTLFEGEPYTLWNVRDLARHSGLRVERSFAFRAAAYPGYRHARTLGVVRARSGEPGGGGWRGEDRAARSYVFVRRDDDDDDEPAGPAAAAAAPAPKGKKRPRTRDDDDDDDDDSSSSDDG